MGLIQTRSEGTSQIPAGEKLRWEITSAEVDEGMHGPQAKMTLQVIEGEHLGSVITDWSKLSRPRLDFVANLRNKNYSDDKIADILRQRGYKFDRIDEPEEELMVSEGGKLYKILVAVFDGDLSKVDQYSNIDDLLDGLVDRTFVAVTKNRGQDDKYTGITWDMIYTDPKGDAKDAEEDFDKIPW